MPIVLKQQDKKETVPVVLVLCDSTTEGEATRRLAPILREYGEIFLFSETGYLVNTDLQSNELFERLKRKLGPAGNESLLILPIPDPYTGRAPSKVRLWIDQLQEPTREAKESPHKAG